MLVGVLLGLGIAASVVAMWCWMCFASSLLSGWRELSERFGHTGRFQGSMHRFQKLGPSRWAPFFDAPNQIGTLNMGMNDEGLYLVPMVPFKLFHKPLLIPWSEMNAQPYRKLFVSGHRVTLRSFPDIALYLYGDWFYDAASYLNDLQPP